jgi:hypothetical protein
MSNTVLRIIEVEVYDEKVNPLIGDLQRCGSKCGTLKQGH